MLKFYNYNISSLEVPNNICLNFHISNCQNRCSGCFSTWLWNDEGDFLSDYFNSLIIAYKMQINCVCFLGEGDNTLENHSEFLKLCQLAYSLNVSTCLYIGRNCEIEEWMNCFDFVKTGAYKSDCGPLTSRTTNQRFYKKILDNKWEDLTKYFQDK